MSAPVVLAPPRRLTLEEFLAYGEPDRRYELVRGIPVEMPAPSKRHQAIVTALLTRFNWVIAERDLPYTATVLGVQTETDTVRIPDIVVCHKAVGDPRTPEAADGVVRLALAAAVLVVEVTSTNWRDDYEAKRTEYGRRGIGEYVIVDTRQDRVVVCRRPVVGEGRYAEVLTYGSGEVMSLEALGGVAIAVDGVLGGETADEVARAEVERLAAERSARLDAEARAAAEHQAKLDAETRAAAERQAKLDAEARIQAAEARAETERQAKLDAEARAEAERQARAVERQARLDAEARAETERQARAQLEAELARLRAQRLGSSDLPPES
ncbi:Uma2 family endonuclease [Chloracidobacterium validum]|uniref:Uma2 family endonuclease n=1 Tax=Chloracidobacterium validum TaxID=2821543 RepID=A0ABX8B9S1_9BACT|nr:Uma2 family endonuclease [Chloracidobacterium validum]QUW02796.1 Uma2 family endonuclease [Chloracidobacterium validum]